jgi:16S rRNA (guanine(966)-N(2))-methyltransferase RsmD
VRQTLFDILAPRIEGARLLDAFAGSGAIGIEALSRGASRVVFVDASPAAIAAVRHNLAAVAAVGAVQVLRQDTRIALAALADSGVRFDIVYLDPPYAGDFYEPLLRQISDTGLVEQDGLVIAEHFHKHLLPETIGRLERTREVRVGDHRLSFYRARQGAGV